MKPHVRSIYFSTVLEYPPLDAFRITREEIQRLFHELSEDAGNRYDNLHLQGRPPFLSIEREEASAESRCEIGKHTIRIFEEKPEFTIDRFCDRVCKILSALGNDCPPIFFQKCEIRCLAGVTNAKSALHLLARGAANVYNKIQPFKRPPSYFGLRFRFQPVTEEDLEDDAEQGLIESDFVGVTDEGVPDIDSIGQSYVVARFETYSQDRTQVWIEVVASYPCQKPITPENLKPIRDNITSAYNFATKQCLEFLDQWDVPRGDSEDQ